MKRGALLLNGDSFFLLSCNKIILPFIEILQLPGRNMSASSLRLCCAGQGWSEAELTLDKEYFYFDVKGTVHPASTVLFCITTAQSAQFLRTTAPDNEKVVLQRYQNQDYIGEINSLYTAGLV